MMAATNRQKFQSKKKFDVKKKFGIKKKNWQLVDEEIEKLKQLYRETDFEKCVQFVDFPLCQKTQDGLKEAGYVAPTDIQKESLGLALRAHDIVGAAKTGSGKTLAFIIPVLECLYRQKWSHLDGVGALIISPTRELAYQTFEVLRKVGQHHDFSAGLVIGGKHLREEAARINNTNIVICTPGRLLQHMDETVSFNVDSLQVLVLDETDKIMDLGFQDTMNAIIQNFPSQRQTLLFSATQTKSVKNLARLSMTSPVYVSAHEHSKHSTPSQLRQNYIVCELHEKLDVLWSFLKNHLHKKILVFMSSCKQVRYVYESFRRLRPGQTVLCLHGALQQLKRMAVYQEFCRKQHAVLFATDLASRGLDFPAVNWVVQLDCPDNAETYIHRVGRTARYEQDGESLLVLLPSEEDGMLEQLKEKKIPIHGIRVNNKKMWSIQPKLASWCASDIQLKQFAQRAFISYLKSIFFMSNKAVFDINKLDTNQYSRSLGLAVPPRIRFLQKHQKNQSAAVEHNSSSKNSQKKIELSSKHEHKQPTQEQTSSDDAESSEESDLESSDVEDDVTDSKREQKVGDDDNDDSDLRFNIDSDESSDDEIFKVVRKINVGSQEEEIDELDSLMKMKAKVPTKYSVAKKIQRKKLQVNTKTVFGEDGETVTDLHKKRQAETDIDVDNPGGINIEQARKLLLEEDKFDKELYRQKIKQKHKDERAKAKERRLKQTKSYDDSEEEDEAVAILGSPDATDTIADTDRLADSETSDEEEEQNEDSVRSDSDSDSSDYKPSWMKASSSEEEEDSPPLTKKRKKKHKTSDNEAADNSMSLTSDLTTEDQEALALRLLNS